MSETILSITDTTFMKEQDKGKWYGCSFDGYVIETTKQTIKLGIGNEQSCCESWGYFMSEDDVQSFVGTTLLDIKLTDTALNTVQKCSVYDGGIMFVDLITDNGVLQFVAYNEHNGYYGHTAIVLSEQLMNEETL